MTTHIVDQTGTSGAFTTIQAAIDASSNGDTIIVLGGVYEEDLAINKGVAILGARSGVAGTDASRSAALGTGETTIDGAHTISVDDVTIDGVRFLNDTLGGNTVNVTSGTDLHILNSIFYSTVAGGGSNDRAIFMAPIASGTVTIEDNYITGNSTGKYSGASWNRGIWTDGGGVHVVIQNNTLESTRTGINADNSGPSIVDILNNAFSHASTGVTVGINPTGVTISGTTSFDVDLEFNYRNLTQDLTLDLGSMVAAVTATGIPAIDAVALSSGTGHDSITGSSLDDIISANDSNTPGAADNDTVSGGAGNDRITGVGGADQLSGNADNDTLNGGAGDDTLNGGTGQDSMTGGTGNDTFNVGNSGDVADETGGNGIDLVNSRITFDLSDGVHAIGSIENLVLTGLNAINGTGNGLANEIIGNDATNVLAGGDNDDTVNGEGDNDLLLGDNGLDELHGGSGNDSVYGGNSSTDADPTPDADTLFGDEGDDIVQGNGGDDEVHGGIGNDTVRGGKNNDSVFGDADDDVLFGGNGNDTLTGGLDDDQFAFRDGNGIDTVTDFANNGLEKFDLTRLVTGAQNFASLTLSDDPVGPGITVDYGTGSFIIANLNNTSDLDASDFLF